MMVVLFMRRIRDGCVRTTAVLCVHICYLVHHSMGRLKAQQSIQDASTNNTAEAWRCAALLGRGDQIRALFIIRTSHKF